MKAHRLRTLDAQVIADVREELLRACRPQAIILFGSAAHDQTQAASDLDVLIVMDLPEGVTPREQARRLHALFEGWLLPLDLIVLTPEEYRRGLSLPGHIAQVAAREGKRIYG